MDPILRASIIDRSAYGCDLCRRPLSEDRWECHHRQLRAQGGKDSLANLLALHDRCHQWIHHHPAWSYGQGFLVPSYHDPLLWRVWRWRAVWMAPGAEWVLADPHPEQRGGAA
ncbi:HNH endonuclease [Kutzneria chonburiensis]|uniref:HNH endonuclease n=1 Tax=Kutzneria chonburiensis TaxID=1483604 RepID=A0ABV6N2Z7_9PSEU|nr:HNH endonuclease signature motif containing protein [Kutzneria chonburiensis]